MKVIVYVEGPSDKFALTGLLKRLIDRRRGEGVEITFCETLRGDRKRSILEKIPVRAVDILRNDPDAVVVAMPDLYPRNVSFPHTTFEELSRTIHERFRQALAQKNVDDDRIASRFHVFCLKHDLEALVLAAEEELHQHLKLKSLPKNWIMPVEDQNHDRPPKKVVEELFRDAGNRYKDTVDAPLILGKARFETISERCPQCFAPFVQFLEGVII